MDFDRFEKLSEVIPKTFGLIRGRTHWLERSKEVLLITFKLIQIEFQGDVHIETDSKSFLNWLQSYSY